MIKNKLTITRQFFRYVIAAVVLTLTNATVFAQEKGIDVDIDINKKTEWYQQSWVWVAGAAVFILLLVALLRGGSARRQ